MPIPVLHLITELSTGGAQQALLRLLAGLDRQRYSVQVACWYNAHAEVAQRLQALGIPVIDLGMPARWRLDALWRLYRLLRRQSPAILHTWLFHANIPGRVLGRLAGVPVILSSERTMEMESRPRLLLNRLTASFADRILCVSQRVADFASQTIRLPTEKLLVIPNGVDLSAFTNLPDRNEARRQLHLPLDSNLIGSVGRLQIVKGYAQLLDAFALLAPTHPELHLAIAGSGPEMDTLQSQLRRLGLENRVTFLGFLSDIPLFLAALDVYVQPSLYEGLPNSILEAMASRLPIVATAVGGTPEVVLDGETGYLVPPHDPPALAKALEKLLFDFWHAQYLAQVGYDFVSEHFSLEETRRLTFDLYSELLAEKAPINNSL